MTAQPHAPRVLDAAPVAATGSTSADEGVRPAGTEDAGARPGFREGMWAVSTYNFDERVRKDMHLPATVQLMDMTLREGRQVAGVSVGLDEVLEFARRIDEVGIHIVEMHHDFIDEIKETKKLGVKLPHPGFGAPHRRPEPRGVPRRRSTCASTPAPTSSVPPSPSPTTTTSWSSRWVV